jgi:hypothetical protein
MSSASPRARSTIHRRLWVACRAGSPWPRPPSRSRGATRPARPAFPSRSVSRQGRSRCSSSRCSLWGRTCRSSRTPHASLEGIRDMSEPRWSLPAGRQIRAARRRGAGGTRRQDLPHPGAVPRADGVRRQVLGSQRASRCAPRPATPTVSPVRGSRIPPDGRLVLGRRERVTLPGRGKFRLPPRGRPRCPAAGASARHPLETNAHPCLHARGPTAAVLGHVAEAVGLRLTAGPTLPPGQREKRPRPTNASTTRTTTTITRMVQSILILRVGCSCERCPVADAEKHSR